MADLPETTNRHEVYKVLCNYFKEDDISNLIRAMGGNPEQISTNHKDIKGYARKLIEYCERRPIGVAGLSRNMALYAQTQM